MSNPWMKKNPLLSMWLSGANAVMGATRSHFNAETKRQMTSMRTHGEKQIISWWTDMLMPGKSKRRR